MTPTERLRELLDERGVEWERSHLWLDHTFVRKPPIGRCFELNTRFEDDISLTITGLTFEQAIEATLGRGTCHVECFDDGVDEALDGSMLYRTPRWFLSCGHEVEGSERPKFCPECGKMVVDDYE